MMVRATYPLIRRGAMVCGALLALSVAAGCEERDKRVLFDGIYFKTKAQPVDKKVTLADFTVTVKKAGVSLDAAREAGGYEGIKYCIDKFGYSGIDWTVGPDAEQLTLSDGDLILRGTCQRP